MILGFKLFLHWFGIPRLKAIPPPIFTLEKKELLDRLIKVQDDTVVASIRQYVMGEVERDAGRNREIDSRSSTLIALTSALGPVVTGASIQLLSTLRDRDHDSGLLSFAGLVLFFAIGFLIFTVIQGVRASMVRSDFRALNEVDVFRQEILERGATPSQSGMTIAQDYERYMVTHVWFVYRNNYLLLEEKAGRLLWAQRALRAYIVSLAVFGFTMLGYVLNA